MNPAGLSLDDRRVRVGIMLPKWEPRGEGVTDGPSTPAPVVSVPTWAAVSSRDSQDHWPAGLPSRLLAPAVTQTQDYTSCCAPGEGPIHRPKGSPRGTGQSAGKAALAQLCLAGFLRQADPGILASPIWPQETLGESPISPDFLHRPYYTCIAFLFLFFRRDTGYSEYYGNLHHRTTVNYRVL